MAFQKMRKNPWIKWPFRLVLGGIILFFLLYQSVRLGYWGKMPTSHELENLSSMEGTVLVDKEGIVIGKIALSNQKSLLREEFPPHLINALVATEDIRFYNHKGTDFKSLVRVFFKTIIGKNKSSGGGSTLTQQLAKNIFPRQKHRVFSLLINKIKEDIIAREIEKIFSKDEILTLYLNTVPFSGNTYGIESAARKFFNVSAKDLNLVQAATLVGTLKANHLYHPQIFPERSKKRRNTVLRQMEKYHFISSKEMEEALKKDLVLRLSHIPTELEMAPYFNFQVEKEVQKIIEQRRFFKQNGQPYDLKKDGLTIYTTLDAKMQQYADRAVKEHLSELQNQFELSYQNKKPWDLDSPTMQKAILRLPIYKRLKIKGYSHEMILDSLKKEKDVLLFNWDENKEERISTLDSLQHFMKFLNVGMLALSPHSGAVRAYIGGIDYHFFPFDRVSQGKRQVGSIFKPFVYAAALENGITPCTYFSTKAITYVDYNRWTPRNSGGGETRASYSLSTSLSYSINTVAVKLIRETGVEKTIALAHKMGIEEPIENRPSIALGVSSIRLLEMAKAYSVFLNEGQAVSPYYVTKIVDRNGKTVYNRPESETKKVVLKKETRQMMTEMLKGVVNEGTARRIRTKYKLKNEIAGKTGTTQNNTDGWFVGLLPDLVTVTWVGNDNPAIRFKNTKIGQGANSALPVFAKMVQMMNADTLFNAYTQAKFPPLMQEVRKKMDCPPTKLPGVEHQYYEQERKRQNFDKSKDKNPSFNHVFR